MQTIAELLTALASALAHRDVKELKRIYADDALLVIARGQTVLGWAQIEAHLIAQSVSSPLNIQTSTVLEQPDLALVTADVPDPAAGEHASRHRMNLVLRRDLTGRWRVAIHDPLN